MAVNVHHCVSVAKISVIMVHQGPIWTSQQEIGAKQVNYNYVFFGSISWIRFTIRINFSDPTTIIKLFKPKLYFTAGECGHYSLTHGYWDFCLYLDSAIPEYSELSWEEKTNKIMNDVMRERSVGEGNYPYYNSEGNPK